MTPADQLTKMEDDYCFAKEGEVYAIYLKNGGTTKVDLRNSKGKFDIKWFNPRKGGTLENGSIKSINGGDWVKIGTAPSDTDEDWTILIKKKN